MRLPDGVEIVDTRDGALCIAVSEPYLARTLEDPLGQDYELCLELQRPDFVDADGVADIEGALISAYLRCASLGCGVQPLSAACASVL